jgi:Fe-S-cluster containining protein
MRDNMDTVYITKDTPLKKILELGNRCDMDGNCCRFGGGFVLKEDMPRISQFLRLSENQFKAKYLKPIVRFNTKGFKLRSKKTEMPYGECVFLKDNRCAIHQVKPLHCRIGTCSEHGEHISHWFTLNYYVNPDDAQSIREWAAYLKTQDTIPGGQVEELVDRERLNDMMTYKVLK